MGCKKVKIKITVAHPGFPRGRQPERGTQTYSSANFPKNCIEMKKLDRRRVSKILLCGSTSGLHTRPGGFWTKLKRKTFDYGWTLRSCV